MQGLQGPSVQQQMELERGNRNAARNRILSTGCHRYNRACLNELLSLD